MGKTYKDTYGKYGRDVPELPRGRKCRGDHLTVGYNELSYTREGKISCVARHFHDKNYRPRKHHLDDLNNAELESQDY